jgi:hypothetical protein
MRSSNALPGEEFAIMCVACWWIVIIFQAWRRRECCASALVTINMVVCHNEAGRGRDRLRRLLPFDTSKLV